MIELNICLIWLEMLFNLMMKEFDIVVIVSWVYVICFDILVVVDNIFLILVYQCLFILGVDIVVYLVIKYLLGYNDFLGGVLVCKDKDLVDEYFDYYIIIGDILVVFDFWFLLCSLKMFGVWMC